MYLVLVSNSLEACLSQILTIDFLKSMFWNVIDMWTIFVSSNNGPLQSYVVYVE